MSQGIEAEMQGPWPYQYILQSPSADHYHSIFGEIKTISEFDSIPNPQFSHVL